MRSDAFQVGRRGQGPDRRAGSVCRSRHPAQSCGVRAIRGPCQLLPILGAVSEVFEDFRYLEQVEEGDVAVLVFAARVGDRQLQGVDILKFDADGRIVELSVMVRPMSGVNAVRDAMRRKLEASAAA